jgi:hypothetical protein
MGWVDWVAEDWAAVVTSWQQVQRIAPEYPELATWLPQAREKAGKDQAPPGSSDSGATHCAAAETVGFSCPIGDNVLSLCWAAGEARVLHYRFGAPGSVALSWPRVPGARFEDSFALSFDVLPAPPGGTVRPRLENTTLSFEVDGNQYTVFEELHDFEPHAQGVKVLVGGTKEVTLSCTATSARLLSKLEP